MIVASRAAEAQAQEELAAYVRDLIENGFALPFGIAAGRRVLVYHGTLALGGLEPYYWGASLDEGDGFRTWHRVVGAETDIALPAFPFLRTPAIRVRAGLGYSLDEPFRKKTRLYSTVVYRP